MTHVTKIQSRNQTQDTSRAEIGRDWTKHRPVGRRCRWLRLAALCCRSLSHCRTRTDDRRSQHTDRRPLDHLHDTDSQCLGQLHQPPGLEEARRHLATAATVAASSPAHRHSFLSATISLLLLLLYMHYNARTFRCGTESEALSKHENILKYNEKSHWKVNI